MKSILLILVVGLISIANAAQPLPATTMRPTTKTSTTTKPTTTSMFDPSLNSEWSSFKKNHTKNYKNSSEENKRRKIFENNFKAIKAQNSDSTQTFTSGMNQFGDLTSDEFNALYNKLIVNNKDIILKRLLSGSDNQEEPTAYARAVAALPTSVNWVTSGGVTPIKNQGQCGSCWAFSAVAALEGQYFRKNGKLFSLSEQQVLDCSSNSVYGNAGCNGGWMNSAFKYVRDNKGIYNQTIYPYKTVQQTCQTFNSPKYANITGFKAIKSGNETALMEAIANIGPISVAIDATPLQFYSSGILSKVTCSKTALNHGVTVVGYGVSNGLAFYLVKNSWGPNWGEKGYFRIARNQNNLCGIATAASYPIL